MLGRGRKAVGCSKPLKFLDGDTEVPTGRAEGMELLLPDPFLDRGGGNPALPGHVARREVSPSGSHSNEIYDSSDFAPRWGGIRESPEGLAPATTDQSLRVLLSHVVRLTL